MRRSIQTFLMATGLGTACYLGGTSNQGQPDSGGPDSGVIPFQADSPYVYVAKVKNILTGLAPTDKEVQSVVTAPDQASKQAALVTLIDTWMTTQQYTQKMLRFFQLAFQQTQISQVDFQELVPNGNGSIGTSPMVNLLIQNVTESFARTVLYEISQGQPLNAAFTTTKFMMTPALAELYAYMDWNATDDNDKINDKFAAQTAIKTGGITVESTTSIPYSGTGSTLDATTGNANYMHWYFPDLATAQPTQPAGCQATSRNWVSTNFANVPSAHLVHMLLYGGFEAYKISTAPPPAGICQAFQGSNVAQDTIMQASDFTTWTLVNVRAPTSTETITPFWDMTQLRSASELLLNTPRVGFFSTPAFHANWMTNTSNQMRVTMNQTFIVALGAQVDGSDPTNPGPNPPGLDQKHTNSVGACVGCHQILDPSRSMLMTYWSNGYGTQTTPPATKGEFVFNNQSTFASTPYASLTDLGNALANHPFFAQAWVEKLCYYVNSEACDSKDADPELARIVADFQASKYSWSKLVEDLLSSPITTNAVETITTQDEGELVSVARKDHLCTLLNSRLNLTDSCGLDIITTKSLVGIPEIAAGLPSDGYGRGAPVPVLPVSPTLFYRAGLENMCEDVAIEVIDNTKPPAGAKTYSSTSQTNITNAINDFVANLMAIVPSDPRYSVMTGKLTAHYQQAIANSATPTDALRSTFTVACLSPNVAGIGM